MICVPFCFYCILVRLEIVNNVVVLSNCIVCKNDEFSLSIKTTYSNNAEKDSSELWYGSSQSGILVYYQNGKGLDSQEIENSLCVKRGFYTLVLSCP